MNETIAEFLHMEKTTEGRWHDVDEMLLEYIYDQNKEHQGFYKPLLFNKDWNWIKSAINHIITIWVDEDLEQNLHPLSDLSEAYEHVFSAMVQEDIEVTAKYVVRFINEYEKFKK